VHAELRPGDDLEQLLERPVAPWERDEAVGELRHARLALVHAAHDVHAREMRVRHLARDEAVGDDARDVAALLERRVGEHAHQPDVPAPVDDADAAPRELAAELLRAGGVLRTLAPIRTAEDAETVDAHHLPPGGVAP
jgi:hypothetical protein